MTDIWLVFLSNVIITDDDDDDTWMPILTASFALYQLYDYHLTSTPIFDTWQSDGGCRFSLPAPCNAQWCHQSLSPLLPHR